MKRLLLLFLVALGILSKAQSNYYLDKNKVKARIYTVNDKFWNFNGNGMQAYEVPKGSGKHAMFANSIWIGGLDGTGQLHLAANTYKQSGTDFWSGPLDTANIAVYNSTLNAPYNRLWKIDCNDIYNFVNAYNSGAIAAGTYTVPNDILNYPAKGTGNFQQNFEPFFDANNNGQYNPVMDGDYPLIHGHQQILSVFNDQRGIHNESGLPSMGLEIHEHSYAFTDPAIHDSMQAINYTTFYRYTIYNRSNTNYHDVYISDWSDVDVGYYLDDYIGTDTANNFAYCYNANNFDPTAMGTTGYGNKPPVSSHVILPLDCSSDGIDNDNDTQIDEPGETWLLNRTTYYNNNFNTFPPATTNPAVGVHFYNYMTGYWKDGSNFSYGGSAFGGTVSTKFVYTGNPATNTGWTESTAGNPTGDRRIILTSGPFNLPAHSRIEWGYAVVFSQDTLNAVNTITQFNTRVRRDVKNIKLYDEAYEAPQCKPPVSSTVGTPEGESIVGGLAYPNPTKHRLTIDLNENVNDAEISVYDQNGRLVYRAVLVSGYRAEVPTEELPPGIYFAKVQTNGKTGGFRFVKE